MGEVVDLADCVGCVRRQGLARLGGQVMFFRPEAEMVRVYMPEVSIMSA